MSLIKHNNVSTDEIAEVELHALFLTSAPNGCEWRVSLFGAFSLGKWSSLPVGTKILWTGLEEFAPTLPEATTKNYKTCQEVQHQGREPNVG